MRNEPRIDRRRFLQANAALTALTAVTMAATIPPLSAAPRPMRGASIFSAIGITAKVERAAALEALGAEFIVESVADFLMPFADENEFAANKARALAAALPVRGCNSFMRDPSLVCVGPRADHARVLAYAATAFRRLREIGGEYIVFGSNTARRIPAGWDKARADQQFMALLEAMAPLAKAHGITVGVEMQRTSECNYLNHIDEVVSVVAPLNHPNIRVLADLFHMRVMGDTPEQLRAAMPWVGVVELAEHERRTLPGVAGDDFRPYFTALARGGYAGLVDIEGDGTAAQLRRAFEVVRSQAAEAARGTG